MGHIGIVSVLKEGTTLRPTYSAEQPANTGCFGRQTSPILIQEARSIKKFPLAIGESMNQAVNSTEHSGGKRRQWLLSNILLYTRYVQAMYALINLEALQPSFGRHNLLNRQSSR